MTGRTYSHRELQGETTAFGNNGENATHKNDSYEKTTTDNDKDKTVRLKAYKFQLVLTHFGSHN